MIIPITAIRMGKTVLVAKAKVVKKLVFPTSVRATRGTDRKDVPLAFTRVLAVKNAGRIKIPKAVKIISQTSPPMLRLPLKTREKKQMLKGKSRKKI